jgi:hypothetical protein
MVADIEVTPGSQSWFRLARLAKLLSSLTILAGAVLVGLAANTRFGLWWLDPAIALLISAICVREGQKAWRGEQCGCPTCS